jgi:CDP-6-deoxy-D-xylo-4-hexulose-3-dehydrase
MPIIQLGLRPIPLDIAEEDLNITLESLCMSHKKFNLKALFITHLLGFCSRELDLIVNMCRNEGIILLEDTCESMGSVYQNKKLGTFGLASSFSTFVGHHYSTVEGGLICTDNEEFADTLRSVISHGWRRHRAGSEESIASGELAQFYSRYTFHTLGYNLRPTEISSYCGVLSLEYIDHICQQRHVNYKMFVQSQELNPYLLSKGINGKHMELCSNFAIPVVVENSSVLAEFLQLAESYGVESRPLVAGNIMEHPFTEKWVDEDILIWADANLPIAKRLHLSSCYLPNRHNLTERQRCTLIRLLNSFQYTKK